LEDGLAKAHIGAALDLPRHQRWIERTPTVMRDPELLDLDVVRLRVNLNFGDAGGVAIGGRDADARALELPTELGWRVAADGAERAVSGLRLLRRLGECDVALRVVADRD